MSGDKEIKEVKEQVTQVSFAVQEALNERVERREKRFFAVIILLICLLVATNAAWLCYEMSMETVEETETYTITQENENGYNNYIGNDGDITNG